MTTTKGPICPIRLLAQLLMVVGAGLMVACSADPEADPYRQSVTLELRPYTQAYAEVTPNTTRAWSPPASYASYSTMNNIFTRQDSEADKSIGIYLTQDDAAPAGGTFKYNESSSQWRSTVQIKNAGTYFLYGYMPSQGGFSAEIAPNNAYSEGARLTLHAQTVTPSDVCIIVGAKEGTGSDAVSGLAVGQFAVAAKATGDDDSNHIFLLFDHLYSGLCLNMKVDEGYNDLRTIALKELRLKAYDTDNNAVKEDMDVVVTLAANTSGLTPITAVSYLPSTGSDTDVQIFQSEEGTRLTTSFQAFGGSFAPASVSYFMLESTYDVYDKKNNLVRQDCKAENKISMSLFSEETMVRGKMYTVNLTVSPTYLYVLSEPDLDSPMLNIEN